MLRSDDFNSNIVARFPVEFISKTEELSQTDGFFKKKIIEGAEYYPGAIINSIIITNNITQSNTLLISLDGEENHNFLEIEILPSETIDLINKIVEKTQNDFFKNGLKLGINSSLWAGVSSPLLENEIISLTIFGANY